MKRTIVLAAVLALALTTAAFAQDFGAFTMDVAGGWTASTEGPTVTVLKDDNTASMSITVMPAEGNTAQTYADAFANEFKKSFATVGTPEAQGDGSFAWDMTTSSGVNSKAMLGVENDQCKLVVITNLDGAPEDIVAMMESIKEK